MKASILLVMPSAFEMLFICAILGGIQGYLFWKKQATNKVVLGIILGIIGSVLMTYVLVQFLFQSLILMPVYAIFGAWLFNSVLSKITTKPKTTDTYS